MSGLWALRRAGGRARRAPSRRLAPCLASCLTASLLATPLLAGATASRAEEVAVASPRRLSLDEALARAEEVSSHLGELRALEDASRADLAGSRAAARPEAGVRAGYTRLSNVPELAITLPDGASRTLFPNLPDNYFSRLEVRWPLYRGGALAAAERAAEHGVEAAERDLDAGGSDLALEVTEAYWFLVLARERSRVLGESLASFEAHLEDVENRVRFGLAAANEALAVSVERDRAELARLRAVHGAEVIEQDLLRLLDLPSDTRLEPADRLEVGSEEELESREALVAEALARRPERAGLLARLAAQEAAVAAARGAHRPQVSLLGGYDLARPNRRILPPEDELEDSWDLGVEVRYTFFDGGRRRASVEGAEARAEALRQRLRSLEEGLRLEVVSRLLELQTARQALAVTEQALTSAEEGVRVAGDRFREGIIPSSELLDAETALLRSGLEDTESRVTVHLARARLERAVGR